MKEDVKQHRRRNILKLGGLGLLGGIASATAGLVHPRKAAAASSSDSLLRKVIDRGRIICGTGSTNPPWHFENEKGQLIGMDIAMARILAKGLFDDESKVEFIIQGPESRIPNINTGKVDVVIQFMSISEQRAQMVNFSRPYYTEGLSIGVTPKSRYKSFKDLLNAGPKATVSVLQNLNAVENVRAALPKASVLQLDTEANVAQALEVGRADAAVFNLSTIRWLDAKSPGRFIDTGHHYYTILYGAAVKQGELDWLQYINTAFTVQMFGHHREIYSAAYKEFFGAEPPKHSPGFPVI